MRIGEENLPVSTISPKTQNEHMFADIFKKNISSFSEKLHKKWDISHIFKKPVPTALTIQIAALLILGGMFGVFFSLYASTINRNRPFTFQGQLFTNTNLPVADNATIPIKFALYSVVSGNANISCLWATGTSANPVDNCPSTNSYTADAQFKALSVTLVRNIFSVEMGDTSLTNMPAIPLDFQTGDYFLQVVVNGEALTPRVRLAATPYALNAQEVAGFALSGNISGTPSLNGSYLSLGAGTFTDSATAGSATAAGMAFHTFLQKTLAATNTGVTTTNAYTLYLEGAPLRGGNEAITNDVALGIGGAAVAGGGTVTNSYGVYANAQTGATNNYAAAFLGGNTGFGTTSPAYMLDIATSGAGILGIGRMQNSLAAANNTGAQLLFGANRTTSGMTNVAGISGIITSISQSAYTGALALYTASSTEPVERVRIDYLGNVGIGSTSPITQLHVPGRVPSAATGSVSITSGSWVTVRGRYAYVTERTGKKLYIMDVSNPSSPAIVNGAGTTTVDEAQRVFVAGNYAYVATVTTDRLQIFDVSNPSSPPAALSTTATSGAISDVYVQGEHAYILNNESFDVFNISNPRAPVSLSSLSTGSGANSLFLTVQGRYAYEVNYGTNNFKIIDISNPTSPSVVSTVSTGASTNPNDIAVQGRYAYVVFNGTSRIQIYDISNPSSVQTLGFVATQSAPVGISVQGRYAYITSTGNNKLEIVDVSDPSSPQALGNVGTGTFPLRPFISGRYAYVASYTSGLMQIFDIGGSYIQQLETGGLEAASGDIRTNLNVNNGLTVSGGINVGMGGIYSTGSLALSTSHANAIQIAPYGTSAGNAGELRFSELSANGSNYVGLKSPDSIAANVIWTLPSADGTSGQALSTNASGVLSWTTVGGGVTIWNTVSGGIYYNTGKVSVGVSSTPSTLLTLAGGGMMIDGVSQINQWNASVPFGNTSSALDLTGDVGGGTSMTLGADSLPVIAYYDVTNGDLKVLKCNTSFCNTGGNNPNTITTVDSTGTVGQYPSITIGTDGFPVIAYYDATNIDLKVIKCGNAACSSGNATPVTLDSTGSVGTDTSIITGTDGFPVISYNDDTNADLKVVKCGNATCSSGNTVTTVDSTGTVGDGTSIAIGTDGFPVIAYYDGTNADLKVAKCGNAACSSGNTITTTHSADSKGSYPSLTVNNSGLPIIAYADTGVPSILFMQCSNSGCSGAENTNTTSTIDTGVAITASSIALAPDGLPIISYNDVISGNLKIVKCGNSTCNGNGNTRLTLDTASFTGNYSSLVIGADGLPIVSYYDDSNDNLKISKCGNERCINYWTRR